MSALTVQLTGFGHYLDLEIVEDVLIQRVILLNGSKSTVINSHQCRYKIHSELRHIHDGNGWNLPTVQALAKTARNQVVGEMVKKPARHPRRA